MLNEILLIPFIKIHVRGLLKLLIGNIIRIKLSAFTEKTVVSYIGRSLLYSMS